MRLGLVMATVAMVFATGPLRAEIMVAPTLEWLADHCLDSGIYVVTSTSKRLDSATVVSMKLTLKRALRGDPPSTLVEPYSDLRPPRARSHEAVAAGHEFLVCLQHYENGDRWTTQLVNLTRPSTSGSNLIAVTCQPRPQPKPQPTLRLLKDRKSIMDVFTARLKSHPTPDPVQVGDYSKDNRLEVDSESEVYRAIYAGSSCFVRIPADLVGKQ